MKSIFIYIHQSALRGGVEKVFYSLFANLPDDEFEITVLNKCVYLTDDLFTIHYKGQKARRWFLYDEFSKEFIARTRQRIHNRISKYTIPLWLKTRRYDIAIAAQEGFYAEFVLQKVNADRKLLWIHNDLRIAHWTTRFFESTEKEKACYEKFDQVVCVSKDVRNSMIEVFGPMDNLVVAYNPIDTDEIDKKLREKTIPRRAVPLFVCVGRLAEQKGYDRLLPICKKLNDEGYKFEVWILGEGSERPKLEKMLKNYRLDNVLLFGNQSNPFPYMKAADWLLCTSRHEGFNMTLHEAIYCGTPVITTDNAGAKELLGENEFGIILENTDEAIMDGMKRVLDDESLQRKYAFAASKRKSFVDLKERMDVICSLLCND